MMNNKVLVVIVGNRDIQFTKPLKNFLEKKFESKGFKLNDHNEGETDLYVFNKSKSYKRTFLEDSELVYEQLSDLSGIKLPLIEPAIKEIQPNKIILIASNFHHFQDTIFCAKIIKKKLNNFNVEIKEMNFVPTLLNEYKSFFINLFNNSDNFFVEVSGGLPATRLAIYLSSLFKKNIDIFEVDNKNIIHGNRSYFEKQILKDKIQSALIKYNYNFINEFKSYFGLTFEKIFNEIYELYLFKKQYEYNTDIILEFEQKLNDLLSHILLQWRIDNTSSFLGEVFSFLQNLGYYLIILLAKSVGCLKGKKIMYESNKYKDIKNGFFNYSFGKFICFKFSKLCTIKNDNIILKNAFNTNNQAISLNNASILAMSKLFNKISELDIETDLKERMQNYYNYYNELEKIEQFRNKCIVSHKLQGYSIKEILDALNLGNKKDLEQLLISSFENIVGKKFNNIFDEKNTQLLALLKNV